VDEQTGRWRGWSPKTAKTTADNFRLYILPSLGARPAAALTGAILDDLYEKLEDARGLSPSVVARCHGQIRAMYGWALRKRLVTQNPALAADTVTVKRGELRVPAMEEVRAVQSVATPDFAAYVQLAATVGARRGTMIALRAGNVDLASRRVTFTRSIAEGINGQVEKGTKADRPYAVSLGDATRRVLAEHLERSAERARSLAIEYGPKSFFFSDDGGLTHWNLSWPSHAWRRYALRAGIDHVRLHDLRHTAASQMLMGGVPISIVAERLGCTEANILRTYRHFVPGSDSAAADLMDGLLSGEGSQGAVGSGSVG
jgi:integrase